MRAADQLQVVDVDELQKRNVGIILLKGTTCGGWTAGRLRAHKPPFPREGRVLTRGGGLSDQLLENQHGHRR